MKNGYNIKEGRHYLQGALDLTDTLPPGVYQLEIDRYGNKWFEPVELMSDGLIDLPNTVSSGVLSEIENFFSKETRAKFESYDLLYKRGILLHGPPGTGKTCIINKIVKSAIDRGLVVIMDPEPYKANVFIKEARKRQPDLGFVVIWEELDYWLDNDEHSILSILDGEIQIDNVVYIATTNHINKIPPRIKNRPSRFASITEVSYLSAEARRIFFEEKIHPEDDVDIDQWVALTDGMPIDHLKDLIVSVLCLGTPLPVAVAKIKQMGE